MAKQQDFTTFKLKLNKYCRHLFGMNLKNKLSKNSEQFIDKCCEQIKEAEKITGKDYLEILEEKSNEKKT